MLAVTNLSTYYEAMRALDSISFYVDEGEIVSLIGANGAGKSTVLHTLSGLIKPKAGSIRFLGKDISAMPAHVIVGLGLAHVPEGRRIFSRMTVRENLEMGAYVQKDRSRMQKDMDVVFESFPRLKERIRQLAGTLSGGEQQMLSVGRAMMSSPRLLMLDEPSMGLAPIVVDTIFDIIERINKEGVPVILIEQDAMMALEISGRAYVIETGKVAMEGNSKDLIDDDRMREVYLGG